MSTCAHCGIVRVHITLFFQCSLNKEIFFIEQLTLSVFLLGFFVGSGSVLYFLLNYFKVSKIFRQFSQASIYKWFILIEWFCIGCNDVKTTLDGSSLCFDGHSGCQIITYSKIIWWSSRNELRWRAAFVWVINDKSQHWWYWVIVLGDKHLIIFF
jgi:hypothetical protein